jgi:hypothetical protein
MAKRKEVVRLLHKAFGEVVIKSSFLTASSGSQFFTALCPDGKTRSLLAEKSYWESSAAEVAKQFTAFSAKALLAEKQKRAADRKKDIYAAKQLAKDKRVRALFAADDEVKELEIDTDEYQKQTDEPEYAEAD